MNRRDFLRIGALAPVAVPLLAGCSGGKDGPAAKSPGATTAATGRSLGDLVSGGDGQLQMGDAQGENVVGADRIAFGLRAPDKTAVTDADVTVYAGRDAGQPPLAEAKATWVAGELAPMALYVAKLPFATPGEWLVGVRAKTKDGKTYNGGLRLEVAGTSPSPMPGDRAISTPTPTTARPMGADPLCSDAPVCSMHGVSLDKALTNGKPTVITFAAPAYCQSETCGPVVALVEEQAARVGGRANFIHVEAYDKDKVGVLAKPLAQWKFVIEPWTYFIDAKGVVKSRLPGAFGAAELAEHVAALGL
ncbi:MAG TPA: hypothetical protein VEZ46_17495 [Mycobacteriales bacterium]|nr:hypothetical protein [Mycobacteriales bacterium]